MLCKKNSTWGQVGNHKFFRAGEVSWNEDTAINILSKKRKKEKRPCRQGNILEFFHLNTLKFAFWMENSTQRWTQSGPFFPKPGHFWFSNKGRGDLPLPPMHQYASISLNIPKYPWKCLNKLFWLSQASEYAWSSYMFDRVWRWLRF